MKSRIAFSLLAGGLLLASCTQEEALVQPGESSMRLTAEVGEALPTRSFFELSDIAWGFNFEGFDQVCVTNQTTGPSGHIFTRQFDGVFTSITSAPTETTADWFAFYPLFSVAGAGDLVLPPGMVDEENNYSGGYMDLSEQSGTREDISQYYVMSGKMANVPAGTTALHFDMMPAVAILRLGNYDGPKHLMIKLDEDTYWDGRMYVVDYSNNCDFVAGGTVYETTICYLPGNGDYYIAVPAGRKLYLTDEFGNNIKTTKDGGLSAGKFYNVNASPITVAHALDVRVNNDRIVNLLQSNRLSDWQEGDELRFCNTQGGDYEYSYDRAMSAFATSNVRAASNRSSWFCVFPKGASNGSDIYYNMASQSGGISDFARKYHLMYNQVDNIPGGNIPSQMTVRSQMAMLVVENPSGNKTLALKFADGSYWNGDLTISLGTGGQWDMLLGHSTTPVAICQITSPGTYYLSIPECVGSLCDTNGNSLSTNTNYARGELYTITLGRDTQVGGESDFTFYLGTTDFDSRLESIGLNGWREGDEVRLCNLQGGEYILTQHDGVFLTNAPIEPASVPTAWFALYPRGASLPDGSWVVDFAHQSGTLQDFVSKYNLKYSFMPGWASLNRPAWATLNSKIAMLVVKNQSLSGREIILKETVSGTYWDGLIRVSYTASSASTHVNWADSRAEICYIPAQSTAYLAVPAGKFWLCDSRGNAWLSTPVDIREGEMKELTLP